MKLSLVEFQQELINALFDLTMFLDKNEISYSLAFGSMLGAVREKDIIPWDFDIDIFVSDDSVRNNMEKFRDFSNDKYYFKSYINGDLYYGLSRLYIKGLKINRPYMKEYPVYDAYIDIYHYANILPENFDTKIVKKIERLNLIHSIKCDKDFSKCPVKRFLKKVLLPLLPSDKKLNSKYDRIVKKIGRFDNTSFFLLHPSSITEKYPHFTGEYIAIPFHGRNLSCFSNFNDFLVFSYGKDWKTPINDNRFNDEMSFICEYK